MDVKFLKGFWSDAETSNNLFWASELIKKLNC